MDNRMSMEFSALPENEAFARAVAAAFVMPLDPTVEELTEIKTAVSEAVSNSIIHGYSVFPDKDEAKIRLECSVSTSGKLVIVVEDKGVGIEDVEKAMEPLYTTKPERERSGMGFTFMEAFMDEVSVESEPGKGTTVHMKKIIRR